LRFSGVKDDEVCDIERKTGQPKGAPDKPGKGSREAKGWQRP